MLVKKGGQMYLYKTVRIDGVPKSIYGGKLSPEQIQEYQHGKEEQALRKQHYQQSTSLLGTLDDFRAVNELLIRAILLCNHGQYFRRSEVRTMRRVHDEY
jgi:hypothetical protein